MGLYNKFKTSADSEKNGVSFIFENARVTMARAGGDNKPYNKALAEWVAKNKKALEVDAISNDVARRHLQELFASYVIVNWEIDENFDKPDTDAKWVVGIENEAGEIVPFSRENVIATLDDLPDFFLKLKQLAEDQQNYRAALVKSVVGN
jgi:hypothetical protein